MSEFELKIESQPLFVVNVLPAADPSLDSPFSLSMDTSAVNIFTLIIGELGAGPPGADGATWTSGTGSPTGGNDGDFYLQTTNANIWKKVAGTWAVLIPAPAITYLIDFVPGTMVNSQVLTAIVFSKAQRIPATAPDSYCKSLAAATRSTTITLAKNGTNFGTIVFSAAGSTGAFTVASDTDFAAGDVLTFTGPSSFDPTLAGVSFNIKLLGI